MIKNELTDPISNVSPSTKISTSEKTNNTPGHKRQKIVWNTLASKFATMQPTSHFS